MQSGTGARRAAFPFAMPELNHDERQAVIDLLTGAIEASRFPMSREIELYKRIREKLRDEERPPSKAGRRRQSSRS